MKSVFALTIAVAAGLLVANPTLLDAADYALSFDGTNDFVQATPTGWQTNDGVTVEAWIYRTARAATSNQNATAVSKSASGPEAWTNPGEWNLGWGWANDAIFRCYAISNAWPAYLVPSNGDLNQWHHLAGVIDVAASQVRLYVDGVLRATVAANRVEGTNSTPVWLGRVGNEYLPGNVDEVRLWKMARSTTDIANNWNRRLSGTESNLVAYWRCDEGSGSSLTDKTSNGFTGELSNGVAWAASTVPLTNVLTVTGTADSSNDSVRAALLSAVNGDTLNITATGTVVLTTGQLIVSNNLSITGPGPAQLALSGNGSDRVFYVTTNVTATIAGLTITDGVAPGDDPYNNGGGIYNDHATLTVSNCTLSGNAAGYSGAGIYNTGYNAGPNAGIATLRIIDSLLISNVAGSFGGGIFSAGGSGGTTTLWVVHSVLISNSAGVDGGGICNDGSYEGLATLWVIDSTLSGNSATYGGGVRQNGRLFGSATLTVSNSTLSGNSTDYEGGGIAIACSSGNAMTTIVNSTLSSNSANYGGGIFQDGEANGNATLIIRRSTLSGNSATGVNGGGGIYNSRISGTATVAIASSILNLGSAGANVYSPVPVNSLGYNIASDGSVGLTATGDFVNTDPQLGPLQYNGGPTKTHALLPGSPALDAGDPSLTSGNDQRGVGYPRVLANYTGSPRADIGAFEAGISDILGDGIPDSWRAHYFGGNGSTTNNQSCATCDATGTGQKNLFKYIAGLNPTNPSSVFNLRIAGQTDLIFDPIVTGRTYTPEFRLNLTGGSYTNLTGYSGPTTNANQATVTDLSATDPQKFYRIKVTLP